MITKIVFSSQHALPVLNVSSILIRISKKSKTPVIIVAKEKNEMKRRIPICGIKNNLYLES